jgi:lipid II:glycine glycyltransferase (peptidoglycan interpeptide bridge formation enzyme)
MDSALYQSEVDRVTDAEWSRMLGLFEDANPYQSWSYGAVHWGEENLSHLVLRRGEEAVGLAQVRIMRVPMLRRGVAYMRWGPLCQLRGRELDGDILRAMAQALRAEYAGKRRLFLRVLPDAFDGSARAALFRAAFSEFEPASVDAADADRTFVLNLTPTLEQLRKGLDQKWRNQLNRAEKNNLTVLEGRGVEHYQMFLQLYRDMWSRKKFDTSVDVEEFGRINDRLPDGLKFRILICLDKGVAVSGLVCSAIGGTGIYLLGATSEAGLNSKGAYLLQWNMVQWLKENGFKYYDLGGIDPERNPGVYHFKKGFSGDDVTRLAPLECCEDALSSLCVKGAELARGGWRGMFKKKSAAPSPAASHPVCAAAGANRAGQPG